MMSPDGKDPVMASMRFVERSAPKVDLAVTQKWVFLLFAMFAVLVGQLSFRVMQKWGDSCIDIQGADPGN